MRERWFFAQGAERRGPFSFDELIEALRAEPDAGSVHVWRKGLAGWTPAGAVLELESRLGPFRAVAGEATDRAAPGSSQSASVRSTSPGRSRRRALVVSAALALTLVVTAWLWPRGSAEPERTARSLQAASRSARSRSAPQPSPDARASMPTVATPGAASVPAASALGDEEAALPSTQLRRLRGVAAWSGELLKLTIYNGTAWRVTELQLRITRLTGDELVEDEQPLTLLPPQERVDAGVADLLQRVAPDRKRAGVNPLDTGAFEVRAGPAPRGFRWEIESARGYPPRR